MKNNNNLTKNITKENAELKLEVKQLTQQVVWLTEQFKLMQARQFGAKSETITAITEQLSFFNEAEHTADETIPEPELETITYARKKTKGKRELDFAGLPTEQVIHELPKEDCICPDCGGALHAFGHEIARRELTVVPAQYKVTEHMRTAYSCRNCEKTAVCLPIKKSEVPVPLIPNSGMASPSLLAQILHNKYTMALPLYRQEQEYSRLGISLSRQTMSNWVMYSHEHYFAEIFKLLHKELLDNEILHADETTLLVLNEENRKARQKSYVWVYSTSGDTKRPVALYDYTPSRAGTHANSFLAGFSGKLHTDGYDAYHCKLPQSIIVAGCWAHMRRKFADAIKCLPKDIQSKSSAMEGLNYCNKLFALESEYDEQKLRFDERHNARTIKSVPLAEKFFAWAKAEYDKNPIPKSTYGMALTYAKNQKEWLLNVFTDGRLELSNNRAERCVRPFAVGRKNWLFCNTPRGANASAAIYSIVETAKANGLNPYAYLKLLLEKLSTSEKPENLLPWSNIAQTACK